RRSYRRNATGPNRTHPIQILDAPLIPIFSEGKQVKNRRIAQVAVVVAGLTVGAVAGFSLASDQVIIDVGGVPIELACPHEWYTEVGSLPEDMQGGPEPRLAVSAVTSVEPKDLTQVPGTNVFVRKNEDGQITIAMEAVLHRNGWVVEGAVFCDPQEVL
ncbi:MAG: hypothetical protein L0Z63_08310, partial [Actinobacteria bacterium]|nr:hypothetical protein [Actinomycetota bacterium]